MSRQPHGKPQRAQGQTRYVYDASGQRTIKINADGSSHIFSYNQQGQLLFEGRYNAAKQLHSQLHYIWLNDTPVGFVVKDNNSDNNNGDWNIYAIHTDHLNTPRLVTNQDGSEVWRWASDAFGEGEAVGSIEFNLRFPGQYYDGESGLHYNYFRDYNTQTERYVQSDPIGLQGGLNTFVYVGANPMKFVDPTGENILLILGVIGALITGKELWDFANLTEEYKEDFNDYEQREDRQQATEEILNGAKEAAESGCVSGSPCGGIPGTGFFGEAAQSFIKWCGD